MAALLKPGDVVLAISYSGETQETYLAAKAARERGARIITITQAGGNRLSRLADYPLYMVGNVVCIIGVCYKLTAFIFNLALDILERFLSKFLAENKAFTLGGYQGHITLSLV